MNIRVVVCTALAALGLSHPVPVSAQTFETVGIRAQGMGGAFVAVADDATATWWNPAGLAGGAFVSGLWERGTTSDPGENVGSGPAWRGDSSGFAVAYPALGLSYYRLRVSEVAPLTSTGTEQAAREDQGVALRSLAISQFGLTAGQSVGSHLVIASTLKLVRAGRVATTAAESEGALDAAADLETDAETSPGLDVGVMVRAGYLRLGVTARNLREPEFGEGEDTFVLERQVRTGVAVVSGRFGVIDGATAAVDTDITTADTVRGEARLIAAGGEVWMFGRRIGLRGGFNRNMVGEERTAKSAGVSFAPDTGLYVDAVVTFGSDTTRKGWGVGARVAF